MRRDEFQVEDRSEIEAFLAEMSFGFLGTQAEDGWPELTPLNYVYHQQAVYFHGSKVGSKMSNLRRTPQVTFVVAKEFAIIPSTFSEERFACPATTYFKSVSIRGVAEEVVDLHEKASVLTALMEKLQPEGGYDPIDVERDPEYVPRVRSVDVVKIVPVSVIGKFKFGQNLTEERMASISGKLEQRASGLDAETAELMRRYCPHHRST